MASKRVRRRRRTRAGRPRRAPPKRRGKTRATRRRQRDQRGTGLLNTLINKLPFELHLPTYRYCGPGTRLGERLARGDAPVNSLDAACRAHDIAYSASSRVADRNRADRELRDRARQIAQSGEASLTERLLSRAVAGVMDIKQSHQW